MVDTASPPGAPAELSTKSLLLAFLAGLPESRRAAFAQDKTLEVALHEVMAVARTQAPQLATNGFVDFISRNLSPQVTTGKELSKLMVADLLLVYGYGREDPAAVEVIEQRYLPQIERSLHPFALAELDLAEVRQALRLRLWASHVPQQGMAPYSGRGELIGWLRVIAIREARHIAGHQQKNVELSERAGLEPRQVAGNAELHLLKAQCREGFHQAFDDAMASLTNKERNLLRYTYLDSLNIDQIALLYKVHPSTVSRWLTQTRAELLDRTKNNLQQQRSLAGISLDELLQLIWSQVDVSIRRHLLSHPS